MSMKCEHCHASLTNVGKVFAADGEKTASHGRRNDGTRKLLRRILEEKKLLLKLEKEYHKQFYELF